MNPLMMAMNGWRQNQAMNILQALKRGNPQQMFQSMMQSNPQFRQFMEQNKGKTPEQVAKENGIDWSQFKSMM